MGQPATSGGLCGGPVGAGGERAEGLDLGEGDHPQRDVAGPEFVFVGFLAAEEVEGGGGGFDGVAEDFGGEDDAGGELAIGRRRSRSCRVGGRWGGGIVGCRRRVGR